MPKHETQRQLVKPHNFMPGETLSAAIKKFNMYDVTPDEMQNLLMAFKNINGEAICRPGDRVLIPILKRHHTAVFSSAQA